MTWFADGEPTQFELARDNPKVALWPHSDQNRQDPRYRLINGEGMPAPRGDRYFVRMIIDDGPPAIYKNCLIPLFPIGDQEIEGTSGVSADGYEFILRIKSWVTPDPVFSVWGFEYHLTYKHAGFPDFFLRQMVGTDNPASQFLLGIKVQHPLWFEHWGPFWFTSDYDPLVNTDVDIAIPQEIPFIWPVSECLQIPAPAPPGGDADLNAIDSDVIFDARTDWNGARFYLEYDIYNRADTSIVVLGKTFNTTQYHGFNGRYAFWNGYLTDMGEILTLDTWIHIRFEWAWLAADSTYRVYWDGSPKGTQVGALRFNQFDTIGKKGPAFIGDFRLKNLIYETGTPASPIKLLEMPLQVDACDIGPDLIKGTTQNMVLPSCP